MADVMLQSSNNTLCWDATTLDGSHINELHVCTGGNNLAFSIEALSGGTTEDYARHVEEGLHDVSMSYSECFDMEMAEVTPKLQSSITNTMSDRVAVNHCVVRKLNENFGGRTVNELNCNVHPLDGIASSARKTLKAMEQQNNINGTLFGKDAATVNIIAALSKLRYKQGSGDPGSFKLYCRRNNIPLSLFPRYVGNRLHIMFHISASIYTLHESLLDLLTNSCPLQNGLKDGLLKDLQNLSLLLNLRVLGVFGRLLTAPWMELFYGNKNKTTHLGMIPHMHSCLDFLNMLKVKKNMKF